MKIKNSSYLSKIKDKTIFRKDENKIVKDFKVPKIVKQKDNKIIDPPGDEAASIQNTASFLMKKESKRFSLGSSNLSAINSNNNIKDNNQGDIKSNINTQNIDFKSNQNNISTPEVNNPHLPNNQTNIFIPYSYPNKETPVGQFSTGDKKLEIMTEKISNLEKRVEAHEKEGESQRKYLSDLKTEIEDNFNKIYDMMDQYFQHNSKDNIKLIK